MPHVKRRITTALVASATLATSIGLAAPAYATPQTLTAIYKLITADKHFSGGTAKVEGTAKVGKTLTAKVTGLTPNSNSGATYKYQWLRNGNPIDGAKSKTYKVTQGDVGKQLSVQVTATKSGYSKTTLTSGSKKVPAAADGTFNNALSYGKGKIEWDDGSWLTLHTPKDMTGILASQDDYYAPKPGNSYWVFEGTIYNAKTYEWGVYSTDYVRVGFRSNSGLPSLERCPHAFAHAYYNRYGLSVYIPARTETSIYFCVEAPSNALGAGHFGWTNDGSIIQTFFK